MMIMRILKKIYIYGYFISQKISYGESHYSSIKLFISKHKKEVYNDNWLLNFIVISFTSFLVNND